MVISQRWLPSRSMRISPSALIAIAVGVAALLVGLVVALAAMPLALTTPDCGW